MYIQIILPHLLNNKIRRYLFYKHLFSVSFTRPLRVKAIASAELKNERVYSEIPAMAATNALLPAQQESFLFSLLFLHFSFLPSESAMRGLPE